MLGVSLSGGRGAHPQNRSVLLTTSSRRFAHDAPMENRVRAGRDARRALRLDAQRGRSAATVRGEVSGGARGARLGGAARDVLLRGRTMLSDGNNLILADFVKVVAFIVRHIAKRRSVTI